MSELKQVAQNTIIQTVGKAISIGLALIGFALMARYLGQVGFGYYSTIFSFLTIFGILFDLGLQMSTSKLISDPKLNESEVFSNIITFRVVTSLFFMLLVPAVGWLFPYELVIRQGIIIATIAFVFSAMNSVMTSLFQKHLIMHQAVISEVSAKIIYVLGLVVAIHYDWGLLGIMGALVLDGLIIFCLLFYFARKTISIKFNWNPAIQKLILKTTWPLALTIALNLVYFKGDIFIMSLISTQAEVGLYGAPYRMLEVLINLAYLFLGLILPILAAAAAVADRQKMVSIIQSVFDFLITMIIPMIVGGYFLSVPIMTLLAGNDFAISGQIMSILLLAVGSIFLAGLFGYAIVALGIQKKMIKFYAINAIISVIGYLIFIPRYSYWGAAWMTVFTELFILISAAYMIRKQLQFFPRFQIAQKALVASLAMAAYLFLLGPINLFFALFSATAFYFIILYLIKGFDTRLIAEIIKRKNEDTDNQPPSLRPA